MIKPPLEELIKNFDNNRYSLVTTASKRAVKIASGEKKLVNTEDDKPINIALEEILKGKVRTIKEEELKGEEK